MVTRPARKLAAAAAPAAWAGARGAGLGAPTRGLGRFFQRSRVLSAIEPMYCPHKIYPDGNNSDWWMASVWGSYNFAALTVFMFCVFIPGANSFLFYMERTVIPERAPVPGFYNNHLELDDPDWRLKRQMHVIEQQQGPRPAGYNRYLDAVKGIKVSDPAFKIYIPSEHGEAVGAHAGDIIRREQQNRQALA